jgi:uroporphyrinogen-III synthase
VHRAPPARYDAEAVLEQLLAEGDVRGSASSCRAPTSRATCCPTGCARRAQVDAVVAYRNAPAEVDRDWLRGELSRAARRAHVRESVGGAALLRAARRRARSAALRCTVAAIGRSRPARLAAAGLPAQVVAQSATAAGLVEELALAIAARHGEET